MTPTLATAANATASAQAAASANKSTSQSAQAQTALAGNMNTFLKMLTQQLTHQDPLQPMDTTQFTNQLVQFSSVEQEININSNLEKMLASTNSSAMASAVTYLGTTVQGVSTSLPLQNGQASFSYTTPAGSTKVSAVISDSSGNVVQSIAGDATAGTHSLSWDGKNANGTQLKDGTYTIAINSIDATGASTAVDAAVSGSVTSMGMDANSQVQLYMGTANLALKDVIKVTVPPSASTATASAATTAQATH